MDLAKFTVTLLIVVLCGCNNTSSKFEKAVWIKHMQVDDRYNPRAGMVQDLIKNHLKPGMSRKAVLDLLGKPYKEGIEQRLPENIVMPDSISFSNPENLKPENADKATAAINDFHKLHARPVYLVKYPVGWSTIDPNFLVLTLNDKGMVEKFRVEQS
jgi:hypothetical protein